MPEVTRSIEYYSRGRGPKVRTLHIETEGAVINVTVGLTDSHGRKVTRVEVSPDDESRGGDGEGFQWYRDGDRIIRRPRCRTCGDHLSWSDASEMWVNGLPSRRGMCDDDPTGVHTPGTED
jgi:hypothetical protein